MSKNNLLISVILLVATLAVAAPTFHEYFGKSEGFAGLILIPLVPLLTITFFSSMYSYVHRPLRWLKLIFIFCIGLVLSYFIIFYIEAIPERIRKDAIDYSDYFNRTPRYIIADTGRIKTCMIPIERDSYFHRNSDEIHETIYSMYELGCDKIQSKSGEQIGTEYLPDVYRYQIDKNNY